MNLKDLKKLYADDTEMLKALESKEQTSLLKKVLESTDKKSAIELKAEFIKGDSGISGFSGESGASGESFYGSSGTSGATGAVGATGPTGAKGNDGKDGLGIQGLKGDKGDAGISGKDGKDGINSDPKTVIDEIKKLKGNDRIDISNIRNWQSILNKASGGFDMNDQRWHGAGTGGGSGSSGDSGASGTSGYSGTSGATGAGTSGFSGTSGTSGFSGGTGSNGASGTSGFSGAGLSGTSGAQGLSGTSGYSGTSGGTGSNGASGTSGTTGLSGTSGATGTSGYSGTSGQDGISGTSGTQGLSGTSGATGLSGTSGFSGTSGQQGLSGTSGATGLSGTSGQQGLSGTSGYSGTSGTSGYSGTSGTSGFSGAGGTGGTSGYSGTSGFSGTSGTSGFSGTSGTSGVASAAFWTLMPGAPTRVSNTTFTVTGDITTYVAKGMIIKWTEAAVIRVAMVSIPSTYGAPDTTITIIGDTMASIDGSSLKYAIVGAEVFQKNFAVAGTISAVLTDVTNAYYATEPMRVLGADLQTGTAGTTNNTTIDINIAGTTCFTTKPTLATTVAASPLPFTADNATALTLNQRVSIDIDAIQTTAAIDLYVQLYLIPTRYMSLV